MALYLIRHASAGKRGPGPEDLERPLDAKGQDQARKVADELPADEVKRVLSSEATRCVQTVQPLADRIGVEIERASELMEGQSAEPAVRLLRALADEGTTAAVCTHRDLIPDILDRLARDGMTIRGRRVWPKGSTWVLETEGHDIVAAHHLGR